MASASGSESVTRAARRGLLILAFINLFNYLDRYVVSALVESLRKEPVLRLTDAQAGWLVTGFLLVYMATSPLFGMLGDRANRPKLIAFGVAIWSLATAAGGLAGRYLTLFIARAAVGIGEAAYGTIAPSLIADWFPLKTRGRAIAVFFAAIPIGSALGIIVGGFFDSHWGWRSAFFAAGLPGLALAALTLTIRDPQRGVMDEGGAGEPPPLREAYAQLFRNGTYVMTVLGYAALTFGLGALVFWMPAFLMRERGLSAGTATMTFGGMVCATGLVGTFAGGWLGDALLSRSRHAYLWLSGIATLLAVPLVWVALTSPDPRAYWGAMIGSQLLLFATTGPVNSIIVNVVRPEMRATAVALSIFAIHVLGDVPSPPLVGKISDSTSLGHAVLIVPVAIVVAGALWTIEAWRRSAQDARRAGA